ncbi:MAG: HAMP domain-containing sensor histidine kinase [Chloroflexota bacterium]
MTIRTKLILWYSGLLAFIIVTFGVMVYGYMRWTMIASIDRTLTDTATQVVNSSRAFPVGDFGSPTGVEVSLPRLDVFWMNNIWVKVIETSGPEPQVVASSENISEFEVLLDNQSIGTTGPVFRNVEIGDLDLRVLTRPVTLPDGPVVVYIQVASSLETVNQAMDRLLSIMVICMVMAVAGSAGVGIVISNQALKPVDDLTRAAALITETDDLSTRLPYEGPMDELGRLTFVFNKMMNRVEHLFGVQQRFVGDVSHELRTPLTAIRGNLELVQRYGADEDSMNAIFSEVDRMSRMVSDLLLLARADYGGMKLDLNPIDLDTIIMGTMQEAESIIHVRGDDLTVKLGRFEPMRINGNPDRIKQLLLNLVSNAIKFTPDGGEIKLSLTEEGEYAVMRVSDTGIGIPEEDIPLVFDRFYQAESSRANTEKDSGTGLGLSICKWIADAHSGTIRVDSQIGHGTTFTVAIPKLEYTAKTQTSMTITNEIRAAYAETRRKHTRTKEMIAG